MKNEFLEEMKKLATLGCKCGAKKQLPPHDCPYQADVNDNKDTEYCTCCQECQSECAADI